MPISYGRALVIRTPTLKARRKIIRIDEKLHAVAVRQRGERLDQLRSSLPRVQGTHEQARQLIAQAKILIQGVRLAIEQSKKLRARVHQEFETRHGAGRIENEPK